VGKYASLALKGDNRVIAFHGMSGRRSLWIAACDDPACAGDNEVSDEVDPRERTSRYSSLAVTGTGDIVISYSAVARGGLGWEGLKVAFID
jgi:hypothetical protein